MYTFSTMKLLYVVLLLSIFYDAKAEEEVAPSEPSALPTSGSPTLTISLNINSTESKSPTVSISETNSTLAASQSLSSSTSPQTPLITDPADTISICNVSVVASEDNTIYKKCTCSGFYGDVDCSYIGITDLPKLITFPKDIHVANFRGNKISNLNADTFYNAREVKELDLSNNQIDFISISAFTAFKKLVKLDLSHNRVWNLPKGMFQGLNSLRRLDLSYNDMINVFAYHFSKLPELRELIMNNNPLQELEPKHFEYLAKLELLDLESTLLSVIPDHLFIFTPRLRTLKLSSNQLTEVPTEALHVLDHLRVLHLSGNPIETIHQQAFRGLTGLATLYLERMPKLEKIDNYAFGDMVHLEELHCSYNFKLNEINPQAFVKKTNNDKVPIVQLFLRQNSLANIPQALLDWNKDVELHLRDNPLHCDCHANWMINMRLKNDFQSHARCSSPSEYEGVALTSLKGHELTCGMQLADIVLVVCGVFTGLLILTLIVSFLFYRRNYRGYTKPHYYRGKTVNDIDYTGGDDGI